MLEAAQSLHGGTPLVTRDFAIGFVALSLVSALSVAVHAGLKPEAGSDMIARPGRS